MPWKLRTIWADVLLAVALTALTVIAQVGDQGVNWIAAVLLPLTVAPVALRQLAPVLTSATIVLATIGYHALGNGSLTNAGVGVVISMFTVATLRSTPAAAVMWLVGTGTVMFTGFASPMQLTWAELAQAAPTMFIVWMVGEGTKRWAQRSERLAEEAVHAVANERVRIARELHDVVAHHMSVISLQAGLAKYVIESDPPTAARALATVGDTSREALHELRRLLDVLRVDDGPAGPDPEAEYRPQPGLAALDGLVERTRAAGLPVDLVVTGEPRELPAGPDLCAYRIAQESLTNVLKHAGPAEATIHLDHGELTFTMEITDDGTAPVPPEFSPHSHGIRGMRERAELYGGALTAGPRAGGGFAVVLRLPTGEAA
ncbi:MULTISPECIES: sensor histidine kinase [unclassified Saccharopolyspora]|uniref:sensor histidine kinase n=1 Tax=unclassified Saccharopolyspora TaxID=2646250 RepID=UPI001CD20DBD|nr:MULTISPECIES: sensor histidine kinase [unclassified Saccharopolyspora]MCA1195250.1 sensor histidine kinase [Saccharopolyspora sp. 6V]MCA1227089.1 sensor histidine kinase [Saccharopolyspora sp. 6M]